MTTDCLVNVKEAAKAMGVSATSLYRLAKANLVPVYSAGPKLSGIRFSIPELREALKRRKGTASTSGVPDNN